MRRSNWKTKVIVVIAFILSIVLGVVAAMFAPDGVFLSGHNP